LDKGKKGGRRGDSRLGAEATAWGFPFSFHLHRRKTDSARRGGKGKFKDYAKGEKKKETSLDRTPNSMPLSAGKRERANSAITTGGQEKWKLEREGRSLDGKLLESQKDKHITFFLERKKGPSRIL